MAVATVRLGYILDGSFSNYKVEVAFMAEIYNRAQLEKAVRPEKLITAIEEGFIAYSQGKVVVPPVGQLLFDNPPGDCHIKYGYVRGDATFTIKVATGFYGNAALGHSFRRRHHPGLLSQDWTIDHDSG